MNQSASHTKLQQGIIDLPNELWLNIMSYLYPVELFALGCASRRFKSLLSYLFWETRSISERLFNMCMEEECITFREQNSLKVSRGELSLEDFRSLHLAGSMDSVGLTRRGMVFSKAVTRVGVAWRISSTFQQDGSWFGPSVMLVDGTMDDHDRSEEKRKHTYRRNAQPMLTQTLRSFRINPILLVSPFTHWAYQLIATSPSLTRISLRNVQQSDPNFWRNMFTWLLQALGFHKILTRLTVAKCSGLDLQTLLDFINRLPKTLKHLDVVGAYSETSSLLLVGNDGMIGFQRVKSIRGSWEVLLGLVGKSSVPRTEEEEDALISLMKERFPALECVTIEIKDNHKLVIRWKR
ncbi:hypothetical protein BDN72DRAFT_843519 [Pluteus cervinus]|uniref:Uncharacterized protein n=1 Tax=Pluteus cervinus TaxID=181527 RepID=A0ACD3APA1_9AGAR|nr:hypothetical protein BDN72DRAFT_843519 [Pluteus cervinus]